MHYDRARLKQAAKQAMRFQRPHPMLVTLLFMIIVNVGAQIISRVLGAASGANALSTLYAQMLIEYEDPAYAIQYVLLSFSPPQLALALFAGVLISGVVTSLWSGLMQTGYAGFCLDMARGRRPQIEAMFRVFPKCAGVLVTQFLAGLFRALWALLLGVGLVLVLFIFALLLAQLEVLYMLVLLAAYFAFFLGYMWVTLRYALVDFLIADQGLTGMDAIRESKRLMQGNAGRLFTLELSFIGWYLLEAAIIVAAAIAAVVLAAAAASELGGYASAETLATMIGTVVFFIPLALAATVGIGILNLWLTPYITGAEALFYDWTRGVDIAPAGGYGFVPNRGWPGPYGGQLGPYGGGSGPYNNDPYRYDPPGQSSFGGYTQVPQPPQSGTGAYPRWDALQTPPAAPTPPAVPEAPADPAPPAFPETVIAPVSADPSAPPEAPETPDDAMYEAPYAEAEAPSDDDGTPRPPNGPSYPQY